MVELFPIALISTLAIVAILLLYFCYLEGAIQIQDENPDIPEAQEVEMATIVTQLKL